jgi:hypothetical protein
MNPRVSPAGRRILQRSHSGPAVSELRDVSSAGQPIILGGALSAGRCILGGAPSGAQPIILMVHALLFCRLPPDVHEVLTPDVCYITI